jgi:hypothetical protein
VARQVLATGTGALNIDATRVGFRDAADEAESKGKNRHADYGTEPGGNAVYGDYSMVPSRNYEAPGRFPPNLLLTHDAACEEGGACAPGCPVAEIDRQSGTLTSGGPGANGHVRNAPQREAGIYGGGRGLWHEAGPAGYLYADTGGASRFFPTFRYEAKASGADRGEGNTHPTCKPLALMRWLIRLVTPPGGLVLDPFAGSGTTLLAARNEGFNAIGIEMTEEYLPIIASRLRQLSLFAEADG